MDYLKMGALLYRLRHERGLTQLQIAEALRVSDKTVSKWERGLGCPDVSLLQELSDFFCVNIEDLLKGDCSPSNFVGGNMKNTMYHICPECGNVTLCTGSASVSCCGRKLPPLEARKAEEREKLQVEEVELDWYITSDHPMEKENYISFVAFATGGGLQLIKQYPEWNLQLRIQRRGHGKLLWYSKTEGLLYQVL